MSLMLEQNYVTFFLLNHQKAFQGSLILWKVNSVVLFPFDQEISEFNDKIANAMYVHTCFSPTYVCIHTQLASQSWVLLVLVYL